MARRLCILLMSIVLLTVASAENLEETQTPASSSQNLRHNSQRAIKEEDAGDKDAGPNPEDFEILSESQEKTLVDAEESLADAEESLVDAFSNLLHEQLYQHNCQTRNSIIAFILGAVMVCDGETTFKQLFVLLVFAGSYFVAYNLFLPKHAKEPDDWYGPLLLWGELSALLAWVAYESWEGVQVLLGGVIGIFLTWHLKEWLVARGGAAVIKDGWFMVILFNIIVGMSVWGLRGRMTLKISPISLMSAVIGGCFISASLSYLVMVQVVTRELQMEGLVIPTKHTHLLWHDFLKMLIQPVNSKHWLDVGLFAGSKYNPTWNDTTYYLDHIFGCIVWCLFTLLGVSCQKKSNFLPLRKATADASQWSPLVSEPPRTLLTQGPQNHTKIFTH